jgi:dihydrofolate reductase
VVAADLDAVIGRANELPWRLPADLQRFKAATMGHAVVMGRRTFQSLKRPLTGRLNVVLTRDPAFLAAGCEVACSLDDALAIGARFNDEVMIIGGALVYAEALPRADRMILTIVEGHFAGDAWLPKPGAGEWLVQSRVRHEADEANPYATTVFHLVRGGGADLAPFVWSGPPW